MQLIGMRLYDEDGYSGRGFSDDEGRLSQTDTVRDA